MSSNHFILGFFFSLLCFYVKTSVSHEKFVNHQNCKEKCQTEDKMSAEERRYDCGIHGKPILPCIRKCQGLAIAEDEETCWCNFCKQKKGRNFCGDDIDKVFIKESDCATLVCQPNMKAKYGPKVCEDPNPNQFRQSVEDDSDED